MPAGGAAGVAATYALCRSWGFSRRAISTSVIVTGVWNILARVALPVIGIGALLFGAGNLPKAVVRGGIAGALVGVLLMALFVSVIASERAATFVGRMLDTVLRPLWRRSWAGREISVDDLVRDLRARITDVVRHGWVSMTFGLVGFFGVYYVLFWFCLHAVGVHMSFGQIFAAYAVGPAADRGRHHPRRCGGDRVGHGRGAGGLGRRTGRRAGRGGAVLGLHPPDGDPARGDRVAGLGRVAQAPAVADRRTGAGVVDAAAPASAAGATAVRGARTGQALGDGAAPPPVSAARPSEGQPASRRTWRSRASSATESSTSAGSKSRPVARRTARAISASAKTGLAGRIGPCR